MDNIVYDHIFVNKVCLNCQQTEERAFTYCPGSGRRLSTPFTSVSSSRPSTTSTSTSYSTRNPPIPNTTSYNINSNSNASTRNPTIPSKPFTPIHRGINTNTQGRSSMSSSLYDDLDALHRKSVFTSGRPNANRIINSSKKTS